MWARTCRLIFYQFGSIAEGAACPESQLKQNKRLLSDTIVNLDFRKSKNIGLLISVIEFILAERDFEPAYYCIRLSHAGEVA